MAEIENKEEFSNTVVFTQSLDFSKQPRVFFATAAFRAVAFSAVYCLECTVWGHLQVVMGIRVPKCRGGEQLRFPSGASACRCSSQRNRLLELFASCTQLGRREVLFYARCERHLFLVSWHCDTGLILTLCSALEALGVEPDITLEEL